MKNIFLTSSAVSGEYLWTQVQLLRDWAVNSRFQLLSFAIAAVITVVLAFIISWIVRKTLRIVFNRASGKLDENIIAVLHAPLMLFLISGGLMCSAPLITMSRGALAALHRVFYALAALSIVWCILRIIGVLDSHFKDLTVKKAAGMNRLLLNLIRRVAKITLWSIALLFVAQNIFRWNISALLAGAGVIGLAIAFAAQSTIANIFGAITLILDKPFQIGDRVKLADGTTGVVEELGLRSTRLRTLDGTLWCVPNRQMGDTALENISVRPFIKHSFEIGLVYSTPPEKMRRAVELLHEILDNHQFCDMANQPPSIYFTAMKDWSLNITVVLWFQTQDFGAMQKVRQELNLQILERFNAEHLEFAFPTSTQYSFLTGETPA